MGDIDGEGVSSLAGYGSEVFLFARITDRTGPGVTVAEGLYRPRFMPGRQGINELTSQALTDIGQG